MRQLYAYAEGPGMVHVATDRGEIEALTPEEARAFATELESVAGVAYPA